MRFIYFKKRRPGRLINLIECYVESAIFQPPRPAPRPADAIDEGQPNI